MKKTFVFTEEIVNEFLMSTGYLRVARHGWVPLLKIVYNSRHVPNHSDS